VEHNYQHFPKRAQCTLWKASIRPMSCLVFSCHQPSLFRGSCTMNCPPFYSVAWCSHPSSLSCSLA